VPAAAVERHRVAGAIRGLLARLAAARPVTVLLDDAHWADPASADVIGLLLHRPPAGRVLLALAARAERAPGLEAALETATRHGGAAIVRLGPLSPAATDALLPASLGPTARARLHRESGGNPFYLEALVRAGAAAPTRMPESAGAPGVPRAVMAALAGEISALEPGARTLAQGAAVAGDPFDPSLAAAAAGIDEDGALSALDGLLAADLVRSTDQPRRFRFRHPLVRRAVYEAAGGGWRLAAHARAAEALARRGATPAERAHHVERAAHSGDTAAVELLAAAAGQTVTSAPATAAGWYEAALRLLPDEIEHDELRLALLRARGRALISAGRAVDARDVLRRVLAMLPREAAAERVDVVVSLAELEAMWTLQLDAARGLLQAERDMLGDGEPRLAAALTLAMGVERAEHGDHVATEALADEAEARARRAGDRPLEAVAAAMGAEAAQSGLRGEDPHALSAADRKLSRAEALVDALADDETAERLHMLLWLGLARQFTGDFEPAHALAERGVGLARRTGQGLLAQSFVSLRGTVSYELGHLDASEADQEETLESALVSGNGQAAYWASIGLSQVALARGNAEAALAHGEAARNAANQADAQAAFTVADACLALGDLGGALAALDTLTSEAAAPWGALPRLRAAEIAVRIQLAHGRPDAAEAAAQRALADSGGRRSGAFGAVIASSEARVLLARGAAADAARIASAGAAAAAEGRAPLWAGRCRTLAGESLAAADRPREARDELRRAVAELEAHGAWGYRDAALRVLRRLGDRPRPSAGSAAAQHDDHGRLAALTPREREVATLVADGQTNAQIAARLHLSESTVEKHVSRVLAKLGLASRAGVVRLLAGERPALG
jgi:DNA-binding CsgD family transcriptional regulator